MEIGETMVAIEWVLVLIGSGVSGILWWVKTGFDDNKIQHGEIKSDIKYHNRLLLHVIAHHKPDMPPAPLYDDE